MYNTDIFVKKAKEVGVELSDHQVEQFVTYYEMMVEKNKVMNLTAITEFDEVIDKHFVDSLSIVKAIDMSQINTIIDVGTGAGFPGIPLKIAFPHIKITLMDSLNKRINFLNEVVAALKLEGVTTCHSRAEILAQDKNHREKYDLCTSRAVANLSTLSEYCLPFVKIGGLFLSYKSGNVDEELTAGAKAIKVLGGETSKVVSYTLPDTDYGRTLVPVHKVKNTPKKYPRKAGTPSKEPIQ